MRTCRARRGFFILRDCGEPAVKECALCTRPMCSAHLSAQSGYTRCLDCEGRAAEKNVLSGPAQKPAGAADDPLADPAWTHRHRERYYSRNRYVPFYTGAYHHDSYYDGYDTRSFDSDMASSGPSSTGADNDSDTGLGDS